MRLLTPPLLFAGSAGFVTRANTPLPKRGRPVDPDPVTLLVDVHDLFRYSVRLASVRVQASLNLTVPGTGTYEASGTFVARRRDTTEGPPINIQFTDEAAPEEKPLRIRDMLINGSFIYPGILGKINGTVTYEPLPNQPTPPPPVPYEAAVSFSMGDVYFDPSDNRYRFQGVSASIFPTYAVRGTFLGKPFQTQPLEGETTNGTASLNISMDDQPDMDF